MLFKSFQLKVAYASLLAVIVAVHGNPRSSCTTTQQKPGLCVPIVECITTQQVLENSPGPILAVVDFVQRSQCGTFDDVHHVCCALNSIISVWDDAPKDILTTTSTTPATIITRTRSGNNSNIYPSVVKSDADVQAGMAILETTDCGKSDADRSVNGGDANLSEFPWMVLLVHSDGLEKIVYCSGTLITDRYVLTVAHCILNSNNDKLLSVRLGEHNLNTTIDCVGSEENRKCAPPVQEIDIEETIYHKDYSRVKFRNDIGLIRLISRAMLSSSVQPICLPITSQSQTADISRMQIAGWPRPVGGVRSNTLQKAELLVMKDVNRCQQFHRLIQITDNMLCAEAENIDNSCKAHSGAPMFASLGARSIQYGIASAGSVCLTPHLFPDIYMKVTAYLPWIAGNIRP